MNIDIACPVCKDTGPHRKWLFLSYQENTCRKCGHIWESKRNYIKDTKG